MGLAFSPMLAVAMAHMLLTHAGDTGGVLSTIIQLGQVVGRWLPDWVSGAGRGAHPGGSGHAAMVTALMMAGAGLSATLITLALPPAATPETAPPKAQAA